MNDSKKRYPELWADCARENYREAVWRLPMHIRMADFGDPSFEEKPPKDFCGGERRDSYSIWYEGDHVTLNESTSWSDYSGSTDGGTVTRKALRKAQASFDGTSFTIEVIDGSICTDSGPGTGVSSRAQPKLTFKVRHPCAGQLLEALARYFRPFGPTYP